MLNIDSLNQFYGGSHVLRNVSLDIPDGSCTAVLGRNGVGKTTLLRCVMGLLPVRTGSIHLDLQDITRLSPQARAVAGLGYVPQGREIFPELTVSENLQIGAMAGQRGHRDGFSMSDVVNIFPVLQAMRSRVAGNLSGGQQQQLAIGRALLTNPKLLILDEPTEGIQPSIVKEIEEVILSLKGKLSILLVEQFYDFAQSVADDYLVLVRGQIVASGKGAEMEEHDVRSLIAV